VSKLARFQLPDKINFALFLYLNQIRQYCPIHDGGRKTKQGPPGGPCPLFVAIAD
jgi:hypothetical protein